ncbi:MAG: hypothetical protein LKJ49_04830 [Olsenella sp.]|jgi:hypothetical protein|nr:hypothetical protein [Olsenella sp.]
MRVLAGERGATPRVHDRALWVAGIIVFVASLVFFTQVYPLSMSNADDWLNITKVRSGLPEWGGFNPSKVLPETLFPLAGYLAAYVVYPLSHDYLGAITLVSALVVAGAITWYVVSFGRVLERYAKTGAFATACVMLVFFLCHFALLFGALSDGGAAYLFGAYDLTGYYHYIVPALWCGALAFSLIVRGAGLEPNDGLTEGMGRKSLGVLLIYLGMFSNLFSSIALAAFAGASLLVDLPSLGRARRGDATMPQAVASYARRNAALLLVIAFWLVTLAFEFSGTRASGAMSHQPLALGAVLGNLAIVWNLLYKRLLALLALCLVAYVAWHVRGASPAGEARDARRLVVVVFVDLMLALAFSVCLSARIDPFRVVDGVTEYYIVRGDVLLAVMEAPLMLCCVGMGYALGRVRWLQVLAPLCAFALAVTVVGNIGSYIPPVSGRMTARQDIAVTNDLIGQIVRADSEGKSEVTVATCRFDNPKAINWPQTPGMVESMAHTLYVHGLTKRELTTTWYADPVLNERYGISEDIGVE